MGFPLTIIVSRASVHLYAKAVPVNVVAWPVFPFPKSRAVSEETTCLRHTLILSLSLLTAELLRRAELHQLEHQPLLPGARHPPKLLHERN